MHVVLQNPGINIVLISFQGIFQLKIKHHTFEAFLVYKFTRARRNFRYIGKIWRHFKTRIDEHVKKDKKVKHLQTHNNEECFSSFNSSFSLRTNIISI